MLNQRDVVQLAQADRGRNWSRVRAWGITGVWSRSVCERGRGEWLCYDPGMLRFRRWLPVVLQLLLLLVFVVPALRSAMRDNDQASLVNGALQIRAHQVSAWRNELYNYDKQYGSFVLLAWLLQLFPHADPTVVSNVMLAVLYGVGSVAALLAAGVAGLPWWVGTVLVLTPSMIFYAPFLGTSQMSLAFLLLALPFLLRRTGRWFAVGLLLLAVATAMRVDALFCLPAIYTAITARKSVRQMVTDRKLWLLVAAVAVPLFAGRLMVPKATPNGAPLFLIPSYIVALLVFTVGVPWIVCALLYTNAGVRAALQRRRWLVFYAVSVLSLWWGLLYYLPQFYSARYFFPTFFSSLVLLTSRRGRLLLRTARPGRVGVPGWAVASLVGLSVLPWIVGVQMRSKKSAGISLGHETDMPTSDGLLPMGSYAAFESRMIAQKDVVDHNQEILQSARGVTFRPCGGVVEVYQTPMASYLEEVAEEQGQPSQLVMSGATSACEAVYLDLRSVMRKDVPTDWMLAHAMRWESRPGEVRPILSVDGTRGPNELTAWVQSAVEVAHGLDARYHRAAGGANVVPVPAGVSAVLFTDAARCLPEGDSKSGLVWERLKGQRKARTVPLCSDGQGGWFLGAQPDFLQKGSN